MGNPKAFLTIGRKEAGYRPIHERVSDFGEVEQTLNTEDRKLQASRCMDCGVPFCHWACPLGNKNPEWQDYLYRGKIKEAAELLQQTNNFPEFTGRVCPALCEKSCILYHSEHAAVTCRENECAVIETAFKEGYIVPMPPKFRTGKKVAVIGAGPSGMAAAVQLNRAGHSVTLFEKNEAVGGLLRFGIPYFKLHKAVIDRRVDIMKAEGIEIRTGVAVGSKDLPTDKLLKEYDAICLCMGAETARDLPIEGRDLKGVHFALELLSQQNRVLAGKEFSDKDRITAKGKNVLVIGGGDTGSDCVGTSNRQGALSVTQIEIMPMPPENDNPATPWPNWPVILKTSSSHEEGCIRRWCLTSNKFIGENGQLTGVEVEEVEWVNNPEGGRPIMKKTGKIEVIKAELVLLAMGFTQPVHTGLLDELGVEYDARGNVKTDANQQSSVKKVFAAGDVNTGASLVVRAIAAGRKAAAAIDAYLK